MDDWTPVVVLEAMGEDLSEVGDLTHPLDPLIERAESELNDRDPMEHVGATDWLTRRLDMLCYWRQRDMLARTRKLDAAELVARFLRGHAVGGGAHAMELACAWLDELGEIYDRLQIDDVVAIAPPGKPFVLGDFPQSSPVKATAEWDE